MNNYENGMTLLINVRETERAITNGELRETSNIRYTRQRSTTNEAKKKK